MATAKSQAYYRGLSYNQLGAQLAKGIISEKDLRRYYNESRRIANARIKSVSGSSLPWTSGEQEFFGRSANLVTTQQLVAAVADINRFLTSKRSTISGRKIVMKSTIEKLQDRGIDVDESNYLKWVEFIQWFQASEYAAKYDSDSEEVGEVFEQGSNASEWGALFAEWSGS